MATTYRGRWGDAAHDGRLFTGTAAATGLILPIYSNTAQLFGLWNPSNSGRNCYILNITMGYKSTTLAASGICLGLLLNVGSAVATAAPISAFTDQAPYQGGLSSTTGGNRVRFTGSAATVTTGLMVVGPILWSQDAFAATGAVNMASPTFRDFDGELMLAPNTACFLSGTIAQLGTWIPSITWAEDDV